MHAGFVIVAGEEGEGFSAEEGGCETVGASNHDGSHSGWFFDGDPVAAGTVEDLETWGVADHEGEEAEVFVFFGVDGWVGTLRAVVAEHAELGGRFGGC